MNVFSGLQWFRVLFCHNGESLLQCLLMSPRSSNSSLCLTQRPAIGSTQGKHSTDSWKTVTKEDKDHEGDFLNEQYIRYFWVITLYWIWFWQMCFRLVVLPNLQGFTAKNFYILSPTAPKVSLSGLTTVYFSLIPNLIIMIQAMGFFFSGITEESQMPQSLISS